MSNDFILKICQKCGKQFDSSKTGLVEFNYRCNAYIYKCENCRPRTHAERTRKQYHKNKDNGICVRCGKAPARIGGIKCQYCYDVDKQRRKSYSNSRFNCNSNYFVIGNMFPKKVTISALQSRKIRSTYRPEDDAFNITEPSPIVSVNFNAKLKRRIGIQVNTLDGSFFFIKRKNNTYTMINFRRIK